MVSFLELNESYLVSESRSKITELLSIYGQVVKPIQYFIFNSSDVHLSMSILSKPTHRLIVLNRLNRYHYTILSILKVLSNTCTSLQKYNVCPAEWLQFIWGKAYVNGYIRDILLCVWLIKLQLSIGKIYTQYVYVRYFNKFIWSKIHFWLIFQKNLTKT